MKNKSLIEGGILVLNLGGNLAQYYAKKIRKMNVFSSILYAGKANINEINQFKPNGILICGEINHIEDITIAEDIFSLDIPVLALGDAMLVMCKALGGKVENKSFKGDKLIDVAVEKSLLLKDINSFTAYFDCNGVASEVPASFVVTANCEGHPCAIENTQKKLFGCKFQLTKNETQYTDSIIKNFLFDICNCSRDWVAEKFMLRSIDLLKEAIGDGHVLLGLSGGVDSAVVAALLYKAIGERLHCVFVDHGFMRKGEPELVKKVFTDSFPVSLTCVDAGKRFMDKLEGVSDAEQKRKIIGAEFISVFLEEAKKIGKLDHFAQGTIYPDVIESGAGSGGELIKSHHNVGGLPELLGFNSLIEPLRWLFKPEVRLLGTALGLPSHLVDRQPFPGPGIAIRCLGAPTFERVEMVRLSDAILREEVEKFGLKYMADQYFTVLTGVRSVGIHEGKRSYFEAIAIRAVKTDDFMTAENIYYPKELLDIVSRRILSEVPCVSRVLLDISPKPPASIEWE
ncbi:MAG: glutamine-hydrolyzing GMP synthase [Christensenellaceae bacterium]|nr:glutamine-hydrolyzing GMP synthase [Christensenellaceae bacterium]